MNDPTRAEDTGNRSELNPASDAPQLAGDKPAQPRRPASSSRAVARSAGIVSLAVMSSRVLGLVREMVFAYFFGASKGLANDAYVIAFRIPNLLRDLFAEGALSSAFVTVFSDYLVTKDEKEALRLSNLVTNALIVILGVLVVLGIIFAEPVVRLIAPGFEGNEEKFRLTVELARIMMPFILLVALAAQAMGVLNARDRFGVPAMASTFFNIGSIVGGIVMAVLLTDPTFSAPVRSIVENPTKGIVGMAYGVLIGGLAQYAIQWPSLRRVGFRYRPVLSFSDPGLRRVFKLMGPAVIGAAAVQVNVLVNSNFASNIPGEGPVSWLNYSFRLMQFPIGVFGVAIATATLPAISRQAALRELGDFRRTLASSLRLAFVLTIPSAVGLIVLGQPIIALIYERGRFGAEDSARTANALACYAIGLAGYAAVRILAPAFYALGDAKTPMRISLFSMVLNFVMNWLLVEQFHERGLALSTSSVAILNFAVLYFAMRKRIKGLEGRATLAAMAKILGASVIMGAACLGVSYAVDAALADGFVARLGKVVGSVLVGAGVFYLIASWLKVAELKMAGDMIAGRFRRMFRRSQTQSLS